MSDRPKQVAAGPRGVAAALSIAVGEMGPVRAAKALARVNQTDGFDCPSCAWPDSERRHHAEFCENGAKAVAWEATRRHVGADFFAGHDVALLATKSGHWLEAQGRLTEPMHRRPGDSHFRPITWDDATRLVADRLGGLTDPNRAAFYTSGRTSNEAAFLYQLLARRLGTNNLPDCSNMCHESSGVALTQTIGIGKGTVSLSDISDHADLVVIVGQNPGTNHPRMLGALETLARRGGRIVAINPLPEAGLMRFRNPQRPNGVVGTGTPLADVYLPIRVNGDHALFAEVNRRLVARGAIDEPFIDGWCDGFDDARVAWEELDPDLVAAATGLTDQQIESLVEETVRARSVIVCWAMGLTQHRNAVATIREIVNYLLLRGNIGRPGAGACPVRGHSNVQGDRTMGIHERPAEEFLASLDAEFGFRAPRADGFDVVRTIEAMRDGEIDVFMAMGGNFAAATPDTALTESALATVPLVVHVSTKLNRSHVVAGREALILPSLGRTDRDVQSAGEQFVTVEDSMSVVHASRGRLDPPSADVRSEPWIVAEIAHRTLGADPLDWRAAVHDYDRIRERIAAVVPGFADVNRRVRESGGFVLPNPPRDERRFTTETGRARFTVQRPEVLQIPVGHLVLQTVRSHDQFNTTVYGLDDRYRGIAGQRTVIFVHPDDLTDAGVHDGDLVDIVSVAPDGERRARAFRAVAYPTPRGCAAAYFPEANVLVPLAAVAHESNTPASKSIVIRIEPTTSAGAPIAVG
jgi:molybdopterin-dependent oxidoreductase alpha subunit